MVHIVFDTSSVSYEDFMQSGGGALQEFENYYRGSAPYQRGYGRQYGAGVGDVFRGIWRFFLPIAKRVGAAVANEALSAGHRVLDRVAEGENVKRALVSEGKRGIDTMLERGGLPKQFGTGGIKRKKKRTMKHNTIPTHQTVIGRSVIKKPAKKRIRSDAFGLY